MRAPTEPSSPWDSPRKARARRVVLGALSRLGYGVEKLADDATFVSGPASSTIDLQRKVAAVPGMITLRRAMYLYWLAFAGSIEGDIIELGSWQGRSTIALAQACADSENGVVHAVDTFAGNPGHESNYTVGADDLSDLESNFRRNVTDAGLSDRVRVYPMRSSQAASEIDAASVRMLYIDAEHAYEPVKEELELYADKLAPGGLLTFDDYSTPFPGVSTAIHEHLAANRDRYAGVVQDNNFLVLRRRPRAGKR